MTTHGVRTIHGHGVPRGGWAGRARISAADLPALLWRERWIMAGVFALIAILGLLLALSLKTAYPANASVLVRLGQEYVYEPRAGDAGRGAVPDADQVLQSEVEILGSPQLKERVIARLGLSRIYPDLGKKYAGASAETQLRIRALAVRRLEQGLKIATAPDTPVIRVAFEHRTPQMAAGVLNALLEEYLLYRRGVLETSVSPALEQQRLAFQARLAEADTAYQDFLERNRIGDFETEKTSLAALQGQLDQQRALNEIALQERLGRLSVLTRQLGQLAPEVSLYRDVSTAGSEKLVSLRLQREDLLSRYKPDARPVLEVEAQIAQLEQAIARGRAEGEAGRRIGLNPVHQTLQTERIQLSAEVAALRQSQAALARQLIQLTQRRQRLAELEPMFQDLSIERDVLLANVRDFTVREAQSRAAQEIAAQTSDNIRIIARATPPARGKSLRRPVFLAALLFAGFSALCAGLARMWLRPGLPTPAVAARTLDLPVLAGAAFKAG